MEHVGLGDNLHIPFHQGTCIPLLVPLPGDMYNKSRVMEFGVLQMGHVGFLLTLQLHVLVLSSEDILECSTFDIAAY